MQGNDQVYTIEGVGPVSYSQYIMLMSAAAAEGLGPRTMSRNREPFALGIEGEYWVDKIPALAVPVKPTRKVTGDKVLVDLVECHGHLLVIRTEDNGFRIYSKESETYIREQLMAAAFVQNYIDNYVTSEGNHGEETNTEA
jgi:hypothetical protein